MTDDSEYRLLMERHHAQSFSHASSSSVSEVKQRLLAFSWSGETDLGQRLDRQLKRFNAYSERLSQDYVDTMDILERLGPSKHSVDLALRRSKLWREEVERLHDEIAWLRWIIAEHCGGPPTRRPAKGIPLRVSGTPVIDAYERLIKTFDEMLELCRQNVRTFLSVVPPPER